MATARLTDKAIQAAKAEGKQRLEIWDAATPGLCLRVTESRKTFVLRYRTEDGRQPRLTLGTFSRAFGIADAREAAARLRVEVQDGKDPAGEKKRRKAAAKAQPIKTFDDLADAFLEASESGVWRPRNKKKRERTIHDERAILKRHVRPTLGGLRLEEIDRTTVRSLLRKMMAKGIGAQTNRTHAVIRQAFAYAVGEERLSVNPAAGLPPVADEKPRERVLTDEELKALWAALKSPAGLKKPARKGSEELVPLYLGRPVAIAVQLCALLLQRRKEVAGMRIEDLDLENGVWTIPAAQMKGGRTHVVPLPSKAVELIREAIGLAKAGRTEPVMVFPGGRDQTRGLRPDTISHAVSDLMGALALKAASPHDLRRTGATNLVSERLAVAPFIVSKVLGHSSDTGGAAAVTLAHYALHDYAPEKRRALEAWEGLLLEIVGEQPRKTNVRSLRGRP